jgi:hypothetical protein
MAGHVLGGVKENPAAANSAESDGLGRFAVDEHNKRQASFAPSRFLVPFSRALGDLVDSGFSF